MFLWLRVQKASCIYCLWTDDAVLPQPPTHQGLCFGLTLRWTPVGGRPCSSARRRRCPVSPFRPRPPSVASFLYLLQGFALFFILAPSGPCERQLRYVKRPLPANQPHTPATGRAPPSQQARPPRFPTSSPNGTHVRAQSRARRAPDREIAL